MFGRFIRRSLLIVYIVTIIFFLAACLSPFLNPATWWVFGFLGLAFPCLFIAVCLILAMWLVARSRWSWLAIIALLLGWKNIAAVFAFHPGASFSKEKKDTGTLRIMTWNTKGFYPTLPKVSKEALLHHRQSIFKIIKEYDPDVIAIQEFSSIENGKGFNNLTQLKNMGYSHYYFSRDFVRNQNHYSGTAIFSRYPVIDSSKTLMPKAAEDEVESFLRADIVFHADTIRIFTGHLQSYRFMPSDYNDFSKIRKDANERVDASKNIVRKMRTAFEKRGIQTDIIRKQLDESTYPEIFCGDLNDVPGSYAYFSVKNKKTDAFIAKGFGFGQTYYSFSSGFMRQLPSLRIDYIFADPRFTVQQCTRVPVILSDHIPVVADVVLPGE